MNPESDARNNRKEKNRGSEDVALVDEVSGAGACTETSVLIMTFRRRRAATLVAEVSRAADPLSLDTSNRTRTHRYFISSFTD